MTKVFFAKTRTLTGEEFEKAFAAADGERQKKVLMKKSPDGPYFKPFRGTSSDGRLAKGGHF